MPASLSWQLIDTRSGALLDTLDCAGLLSMHEASQITAEEIRAANLGHAKGECVSVGERLVLRPVRGSA